ncbi:MAG: hypothetical protein R3F54_29035 [Alphaproteobacteria bacterium]
MLFVVAYIWFAEPASRLVAAARWACAALLDAIGLDHWTWTVATKEGDELWQSNLIRLDSWHLEQVRGVLASFMTGMTWVTGLTLLGLSLSLAWWLGKRRAIVRYEKQQAVPEVQRLTAADDSHPDLPVSARERPEALNNDQERDQSADQDEKPDIEGLFQQEQDLKAWDEARHKKPVARHKWRYRSC